MTIIGLYRTFERFNGDTKMVIIYNGKLICNETLDEVMENGKIITYIYQKKVCWFDYNFENNVIYVVIY